VLRSSYMTEPSRSDTSRLYARASEGIDEYWRLKEES
jgi:hypothetical protein